MLQYRTRRHFFKRKITISAVVEFRYDYRNICYVTSYIQGSSLILSFVEPYGQKIKVMLSPVQVAGLDGGPSAAPLSVDQRIGHPVAVITLGGCCESNMGLGRLDT